MKTEQWCQILSALNWMEWNADGRAVMSAAATRYSKVAPAVLHADKSGAGRGFANLFAAGAFLPAAGALSLTTLSLIRFETFRTVISLTFALGLLFF